MPRPSYFKMFADWTGGMNTSLDPAAVPPQQVTKAINVEFGTRGSRRKRDGINFDWDSASNSAYKVLKLHDFWYGASSNTKKLLAVHDSKAVYSYGSDGTRSSDLFAGTAWSSAITLATATTYNNLAIIAVDGTGNVVKKYDGTTFADLGGTPPAASICGVHAGRLWLNDKTQKDRLHYSPIGDAESWNGTGDSGAIDIGIGDGDPEGITAFWSFKGVLFVAKKTSLFRIDGFNPEDFQVTRITTAVGCVGPNAWALIDSDDAYWVSDRGIHSLKASDVYGSFEAAFVSLDVQRTFNENFSKARLKYTQCAYLPSLNSFAATFTDTDISATTSNTLYLFNVPFKAWYVWQGGLLSSCESIVTSTDSASKRFYIGTNTGRVAQCQAGLNYDVSTASANTAIEYTIETGTIFPDGEPLLEKAFLSFALIYAPIGDSEVTVTLKIDNYPRQALSFADSTGSDFLGVDFVLGSSELGSEAALAPYARTIDGVGRGVRITFSQSGVEDRVELLGYAIEYIPSGFRPEVIT